MPQIALLAVAGATLYVGLKWAMRLAEQDAVRQAKPVRRTRDMGRLAWDPATKTYRPLDR